MGPMSGSGGFGEGSDLECGGDVFCCKLFFCVGGLRELLCGLLGVAGQILWDGASAAGGVAGGVDDMGDCSAAI